MPLPMARKGKRAKGDPGKPSKVSTRNRYDSRNLVLKILEEGPKRGGLTTTEVTRRVSELRGEKVPEDAVSAALRGLVGEKVLRWRRVGHKKAYRIPTPRAPTVPGPSAGSPTASVAAFIVPEPAKPASEPAPPLSALPHRLALGEIAIVRHDGESLVSATNVHGALVLKRHRMP